MIEAGGRRVVLLVEDSHEDYETICRAFQKLEVEAVIDRCEDGDEALDYLQQCRGGAGKTREVPSLILLDLNLPGTDGWEVLRTVKEDLALRGVPVVIVSTTNDRSDVRSAYELGASGFVVKPACARDIVETVRGLVSYWFRVVALPEGRLE